MSKNMKYSDVRKIVYSCYKGKCAICGKHLPLEDMCISLIVPKSKGGYKDFSNMQAACECCARMKNDMTQEEFSQKIYEIVKHNLPTVVKSKDNAISLVFQCGYQAGQEKLKERVYKHFSISQNLFGSEKGGDIYDE